MKLRIEVEDPIDESAYSFPVDIPQWLWWLIQRYEI